MENNKVEPLAEIFSEEEWKKLNFTQEERDAIEGAVALAETCDLLPDQESAKELNKFYEKIEKNVQVSDDLAKDLIHLLEVGKKDPEFRQQLFALYQIANSVEEEAPAVTEKVSLADVEAEKLNQKVDSILKADKK